MTFRRGVVYSLNGYPHPAGLLVLTSDVWNAHMGSVGGAVVSGSGGGDILPVALPPVKAFVNPTMILALRHTALGEPLYTVSPSELRTIEEYLQATLALNGLRGVPPVAPGSPPGLPDYPRWGNVYFGPPLGGEVKRYVVVSADVHNQRVGRVLAIRTTSKVKRDSVSFPVIQGGGIQACCGDMSLIGNADLHHAVGQRRPSPSSLSIGDMAAIARGLAQTHQL